MFFKPKNHLIHIQLVLVSHLKYYDQWQLNWRGIPRHPCS